MLNGADGHVYDKIGLRQVSPEIVDYLASKGIKES